MQPQPNSVYSQNEMGAMRRWQQIKDSLLSPVVSLAQRLNISANMISLTGVVVILAGAFIAVRLGDFKIFLWSLWLHVFLDGLDGAVARQKDRFKAGSLIDAASDFVGLIATITILGVFTPIPGLLLFSVIALWGLVLILAIRRNQIGKPYQWLIRPRLPLYILVTIDLIFSTAFSYLALMVVLGLLAVTAVIGLTNLGKRPAHSAPSR